MIAVIPNPVHGECRSHLGILGKLESTLARTTTTGGFALVSNRSTIRFHACPVVKVARIRQEPSAAVAALPVHCPLLDVGESVVGFCVGGAEPVDCAGGAVGSVGF